MLGENLAKSLQDISRGGNFHDTSYISFIKAYQFYFRMGVICVKTKAWKTRKLPPRENFHVYINTYAKLQNNGVFCVEMLWYWPEK